MQTLIAEVDATMWTALSTLIWFTLICIILAINHKHIDALLRSFIQRIKSGGAIKIAGLELDAIPEAHRLSADSDGGHSEAYIALPQLNADRNAIYKELRGVMIVHTLVKSNRRDLTYDIIIYAIPHKGSTLLGVDKIEYFFGRMWSDQVFISGDRGAGFAIRTSAYGPFLAYATIRFTDGSSAVATRYIDFEMGFCAPRSKRLDEEKA